MEAIIWVFWLTVAGIILAPFIIAKGVKMIRGRKSAKATNKAANKAGKTSATATTNTTTNTVADTDVIDVEYTVVK